MNKTQDYLRALAEPLRLRILYLLRQTPLSVSELTQVLAVSQPNVSHHLKALRGLQLVDSTRQGTVTYYFSPAEAPLPEQVQSFFGPLWLNLPTVALELEEVHSDRERLALVLSKRGAEADHKVWELWRSLQPDIPFTREVLLNGLPRAALAVDIGCGDGNFLNLLRDSHHTVIGLDISSKQLALAQQSHPALLLQADAVKLPLRDGVATSVYLRMTLQFIPDGTAALREAWRLVAVGGCLSVIDSARVGLLSSTPNAAEVGRLFSGGHLRHYRREGSLFLLSVERRQ